MNQPKGTGENDSEKPGDRLPVRNPQDKTRGVFVNNGAETDLISGRGGPTNKMPPDTPGMNARMQIRTHVEAHAAALMRKGSFSKHSFIITYNGDKYNVQ